MNRKLLILPLLAVVVAGAVFTGCDKGDKDKEKDKPKAEETQ